MDLIVTKKSWYQKPIWWVVIIIVLIVVIFVVQVLLELKSINNQSVLKVDEVQRLVENSKVGIPLQIQVLRDGKISQVSVKPAPLPVNRGN